MQFNARPGETITVTVADKTAAESIQDLGYDGFSVPIASEDANGFSFVVPDAYGYGFVFGTRHFITYTDGNTSYADSNILALPDDVTQFSVIGGFEVGAGSVFENATFVPENGRDQYIVLNPNNLDGLKVTGEGFVECEEVGEFKIRILDVSDTSARASGTWTEERTITIESTGPIVIRPVGNDTIAAEELFTMNTPAGLRYIDENGEFQLTTEDQFIIDHVYNPSTDQWEVRGTPIFRDTINTLNYSNNLTSANWDSTGFDLIVSTGVPARLGSIATRFEGDGTTTLPSVVSKEDLVRAANTPVLVMAVVETINAPEIAIANGRDLNNCALISLNTATGVATDVTGSREGDSTLDAFGVIPLGIGPNNGLTYILWSVVSNAITTSTERQVIYPVGLIATAAEAIVHHVQRTPDARAPGNLVLTSGTPVSILGNTLSVNTDRWQTNGQGTIIVEWENALNGWLDASNILTSPNLVRQGEFDIAFIDGPIDIPASTHEESSILRAVLTWDLTRNEAKVLARGGNIMRDSAIDGATVFESVMGIGGDDNATRSNIWMRRLTFIPQFSTDVQMRHHVG